MIDNAYSPGVSLAKSVERLVYVGRDVSIGRVERVFLPEPRLIELGSAYVAIVLGPQTFRRMTNTEVVFSVQVAIEIAKKIGGTSPEIVDEMLDVMSTNVARLYQNRRLPEGLLIDSSVMQPALYDEVLLRQYVVFASRIMATYDVEWSR